MPFISALTFYPIKSCGGISLTSAVITETGLSYASVHDREWMLVDASGLFISQREYPRMALIQPAIEGNKMILSALDSVPLEIDLDGRELLHASSIRVQVWDDIVQAKVYDQGVAHWFCQVLGIDCRLVRFDPSSRRLASQKWTGTQEVGTLFSDGFPLLLTASASLDDLNQKLVSQGREAIPMDRFRPNIVLDGTEAFEEDYASSLDISSGNRQIQLTPVKPCTRCTIPAVDQATGEPGPDPVDILQTYRANPSLDGGVTFGMNLIVTTGCNQTLYVGDTLDIQIAF